MNNTDLVNQTISKFERVSSIYQSKRIDKAIAIMILGILDIRKFKYFDTYFVYYNVALTQIHKQRLLSTSGNDRNKDKFIENINIIINPLSEAPELTPEEATKLNSYFTKIFFESETGLLEHLTHLFDFQFNQAHPLNLVSDSFDRSNLSSIYYRVDSNVQMENFELYNQNIDFEKIKDSIKRYYVNILGWRLIGEKAIAYGQSFLFINTQGEDIEVSAQEYEKSVLVPIQKVSVYVQYVDTV